MDRLWIRWLPDLTLHLTVYRMGRLCDPVGGGPHATLTIFGKEIALPAGASCVPGCYPDGMQVRSDQIGSDQTRPDHIISDQIRSPAM